MKTESEAATAVSTLVDRARSGDRRAMNDLLAEITPYVARVCLPIAGEHVSDAVQEALLAVYRGLGTLREPEAFFGWVRSVTTREAVRTSKRLRAETTPLRADRGPHVDPLDTVHVVDALERLSTKHRQILALRFYGLTEDEMAMALSVPVGTVRSRLFRARCRFREAWQPRAA
ncbi:RNA polymerase sigma factor [Streptomyces sp. NPDC051014]|uniref:RNA polymerase sigma factor n=1 Tax=Streptomyces sp. NPDC051014 TaxID=3155751 RepID=UPI003409B3CE